MDSRRFKIEGWLYGLAFLLALGVRLIQLGKLPLTDLEANWALQAMQVAQGAKPLLGPNPAYILSTGALFFLFGTSNFLARLIPALAGSGLVFVPLLFRKRLRPTPILLLSIFLALDPGLVAISRQAGSAILAVTFLLLTWGLWMNQRTRLAGVSAGLALLSGPSLWMGLLALGLAWIFIRVLETPPGQAGKAQQAEKTEAELSAARVRREQRKVALMFGIGTLLLGGTLFFLSPNGLSAWLSALPAFLGGWIKVSGVPASRLLLALLVYQPLAVLLGVAAIFRGWRDGRKRYIRLSLWLLVSLALVLLYPFRQVTDLVWVALPLWTLAALELSNHLHVFAQERREVFGVSLLVMLLLVFSWLDYASIALDPLNPLNTTWNMFSGTNFGLPPTRYLLLFSVLILLVISIFLVALGWSMRIARLGAVWGVVTVLSVYSLGMAWSASGLRTPQGWELWQPGRLPAQADLLLKSVDEMSLWSTGDMDSQDIVVAGLDSPALVWLLRNHPVKFEPALDVTATPPLVISPQQEDLGLQAAYRGQDFTWRQQPYWTALTIYDWIRWSVFRTLPYDSETIVFWARQDVFPDAKGSLP